MTRKVHAITIVLSVVALSAPILLAILVANTWLNAAPIVDMRL